MYSLVEQKKSYTKPISVRSCSTSMTMHRINLTPLQRSTDHPPPNHPYRHCSPSFLRVPGFYRKCVFVCLGFPSPMLNCNRRRCPMVLRVYKPSPAATRTLSCNCRLSLCSLSVWQNACILAPAAE